MKNNRICYIEIETNDGGKRALKRLEGLSFRAKVSRKRGAVLSSANVQIANLTRSDIEYLSAYLSPYLNPSIRKKINIYAGYDTTGVGRIFTGDIYKALPSDVPDTWLNIEAKSLYYQNRIPIKYSASDIPVKDVGQSIAQELGLNFDWQADTEKTIDVFNFRGSKTELIKKFNLSGDIVAFEDNGTLKVQNKGTPKKQGQIKLVSEKTGLIGIPEPDQFGVKVKVMLDPSIACGDWIKLESEMIKSANGEYNIYSLDYDIASREQSYYITIGAKNYGIY